MGHSAGEVWKEVLLTIPHFTRYLEHSFNDQFCSTRPRYLPFKPKGAQPTDTDPSPSSPIIDVVGSPSPAVTSNVFARSLVASADTIFHGIDICRNGYINLIPESVRTPAQSSQSISVLAPPLAQLDRDPCTIFQSIEWGCQGEECVSSFRVVSRRSDRRENTRKGETSSSP